MIFSKFYWPSLSVALEESAFDIACESNSTSHTPAGRLHELMEIPRRRVPKRPPEQTAGIFRPLAAWTSGMLASGSLELPTSYATPQLVVSGPYAAVPFRRSTSRMPNASAWAAWCSCGMCPRAHEMGQRSCRRLCGRGCADRAMSERLHCSEAF